jgi:hypothetical protein
MMRVLTVILSLSALVSMAEISSTRAVDRRAPDLFPSSTLMYAEVASPKELVELVLEHPLRDRVVELDLYQEAFETPQFREFLQVVKHVERQLGMSWETALTTVTEGGIYTGVDAESKGVGLLVRAHDEQTLAKIRDEFIRLARMNAEDKNQPDPIRSREYRGVKAYQIDEVIFASLDEWLLITNKSDLGKAMVDRYLDDGTDSLAGVERFQQAVAARRGDPTFWGFANVAALRETGVAKDLFAGRTENPAVELLVGGIMSVLQKTPYATSQVNVESGHMDLAVTMPHRSDWIPEERQFYFGIDGDGAAPPLPTASETLFALGTYRNISDMWLRAGDLFDDNMVDELAKADSNLSTLFSGRDFGEDILGSIQPSLGLIVTRQNFAAMRPKPAIRLPAFALLTEMRQPEKMRRELRRTFQSLIGFLNVVGAMNGQPQLELDIERVGEAELVTSTFIPETDEEDSEEARINFNFSPTVGFSGKRFVVSSTSKLARELIDNQADAADTPSAPVNTWVRADMHVLRKILADNSNQLIAQNMLEEGRTRAEAEVQVNQVMEILSVFRDMTLHLDTNDQQLRFKMALRLQDLE